MASRSRWACFAALLPLALAAVTPAPAQTPASVSETLAPAPAQLAVNTFALNFAVRQGADAAAAPLQLENRGGDRGAYEVAAHTLSGGNWLAADAGWVELAPGDSLTVKVTANPAGVPPGAHAGRISITQWDGAWRVDVAVLLVVQAPAPSPGTITTLAGAAWNFSASGRPALTAPLGFIFGVAAGADGIYISDSGNRMVFRLAPDGTLAHIAGNGEAGGGGDGGRATAAQLRFPFRMALDAAGNLYIADRDDHRVRKVSPDGTISTVAGTGSAGFSGDGGPAVNAALYWPRGVAVDKNGNVYIADTGNARIRKVGRDGSIITVAGTGQPGRSVDGTPPREASIAVEDVAIDAAGRILFTNRFDGTVCSLSADGKVRLVAGNGSPGFSGDGRQALSARFGQYLSVAPDAAGAVYIADAENGRIRRIGASGVVTTVAGSGAAAFSGDGGPASKAMLRYPYAVAVDAAGTLWAADTYNARLRRVDADGSISTAAGNGAFRNAAEGAAAALATLNRPRGVAVDGAGNIYIADTEGNRIRKVTPEGAMVTAAGTGTFGYLNDGAPAVEAAVVSPRAVALDAQGNVYYTDGNSHTVRRIGLDGIVTRVAGTYGAPGFAGDGGTAAEARLSAPEGLALDAAGNLYIADTGNHRVRKVAADGSISTVAGNGNAMSSGDSGPATEAAIDTPAGVAVDAAGNLYISEFRGGRVRKVSPGGLIATFAGDGSRGYAGDGGPATSASFKDPYGLAVDAAGNLYIADASGARIRKVSPEGTISTLAGSGTYGFAGDGGAAADAALAFPTAVAVDAAGRLFIADRDNDRIRVVAP